jgi:hypothetical protein
MISCLDYKLAMGVSDGSGVFSYRHSWLNDTDPFVFYIQKDRA